MEHFISIGSTWNVTPFMEVSTFAEYGFRGTKNGRFPLIGVNPAAPDFVPANVTYKDTAFEGGFFCRFCLLALLKSQKLEIISGFLFY